MAKMIPRKNNGGLITRQIIRRRDSGHGYYIDTILHHSDSIDLEYRKTCNIYPDYSSHYGVDDTAIVMLREEKGRYPDDIVQLITDII